VCIAKYQEIAKKLKRNRITRPKSTDLMDPDLQDASGALD